jgi:hypothetical protein
MCTLEKTTEILRRRTSGNGEMQATESTLHVSLPAAVHDMTPGEYDPTGRLPINPTVCVTQLPQRLPLHALNIRVGAPFLEVFF